MYAKRLSLFDNKHCKYRSINKHKVLFYTFYFTDTCFSDSCVPLSPGTQLGFVLLKTWLSFDLHIAITKS